MQRGLNPRCGPISVFGGVRAPMQSAGDDVVSSGAVGVVVAAGFHDINLPAIRPHAVGVCHGHHPDCGPEPVALGDFGFDLDAAVFDTCTQFGIDAAGLDRLDDSAVEAVRGCYAVEVNI